LKRRRANTFGLIDGGLAGLVWTYLGAYAGFMMVIASMAEMASMYVQRIFMSQLLIFAQGTNIWRSISLVRTFYLVLEDY
jgi:hypothetical protein